MKLRRNRPETSPDEETEHVDTFEHPTAAPLTRVELVRQLRDRAGMVSLKTAEHELQIVEDLIIEALEEGRTVKLPGFIQLQPVVRRARRGRNPRTGESIQLPAKKIIKVKVLKQLADRIARS